MKRSIITVFAGVAMSTVAYGADFQPVVEAPIWNWTGLYAGLAAGGGFGNADFDTKSIDGEKCYELCLVQHNPHGIVAGGQVYGLYQFGQSPLIVGAEIQGLWASFSDNKDHFFGLIHTESDLGPLLAAKGQLGVALDRGYLYATGGWAGLDAEAQAAIPQVVHWSDDPFLTGWTYGAGAKWVAVDGTATSTNSIIVGVEWLHYRFNEVFENDLKLVSGGYAPAQQCYMCDGLGKLKVDGDLDFDTITANISIKF